MAYQRTEYADKTLSMNSLADRKLKIQLNSLDTHKGTITKEMNRERKRLEKELADAEGYMRNRLAVASPDGRALSPRLPRRYSTPQTMITTAFPDTRKSPLTRRRNFSDGVSDLSCTENLARSPCAPVSPTMNLLQPPFNQPRRQSLPPIGAGGLVCIEPGRRDELCVPRRDRRGSYGGKSPATISPTQSGATTPRALARKGSSLNELQLQEVTAKVSKMEKMDAETEKAKTEKVESEEEDVYTELDSNESETMQDLMSSDPRIISPVVGTFHPAHFE
ncbi:uncharacterized protein LOC5510420 [Nematostella vectensis]|uniref:uncharacterized protein LOC5510420 n=1 Tax=Nematostella vectensis TaxID=45351 RepID=UPI002077474E|nr:uncharacterized protein LOC5510420 [Nematostella vectensis]